MYSSPPLLRVQHSRCDMEFSQPRTLDLEHTLKQVAAVVTGELERWRRGLET